MNSKNTQTSQTRRRSGKAIPAERVSLIRRLWREGHSVQEILDRLAEKYPDDAPSERTVQNYVRAIRENRIPWNRLAMDGADARLVFDVLAEVMLASNGLKQGFTDDEATWVAWVSKAAPGLPPYYVWVLASMYMDGERQKQPDMGWIDAYLAFKGWESLDAMIAYDDAVLKGWTPSSPLPSSPTPVGAAARISRVASRARAGVYQQQAEASRQALIDRAKAGDPDAIKALTLLNEAEEETDGQT